MFEEFDPMCDDAGLLKSQEDAALQRIAKKHLNHGWTYTEPIRYEQINHVPYGTDVYTTGQIYTTTTTTYTPYTIPTVTLNDAW